MSNKHTNTVISSCEHMLPQASTSWLYVVDLTKLKIPHPVESRSHDELASAHGAKTQTLVITAAVELTERASDAADWLATSPHPEPAEQQSWDVWRPPAQGPALYLRALQEPAVPSGRILQPVLAPCRHTLVGTTELVHSKQQERIPSTNAEPYSRRRSNKLAAGMPIVSDTMAVIAEHEACHCGHMTSS